MINNHTKKRYAPNGVNIRYCLSGFTLQLKSVTNSQALKSIENKIHERLKQLGLSPIDSLSQEELLQEDDILTICIEPIDTQVKKDNVDKDIVDMVKKAWGIINVIHRNLSDVIYVEPRFDFIAQVDNNGGCCTTNDDAQVDNNEPDNRTKYDSEWHLEQMQVISAWSNYFSADQSKAGQGIVIGHPDTGYLSHPELGTQIDSLSVPEGIKIGDTEPLNQSSDTALPSIWHGTATASLIISPRGFDGKSKEKQVKQGNSFVSGVAPGVTLLPLRLGAPTKSRLPDYSFRLFSVKLAEAINYAAKSDLNRSGRPRVDILSISLTGYPNLSLRRAIINATKKGIIVVVSAGNGIPFVGWPAAYDNVVAVASSTIDCKRADHSAYGSRVNIAAPGEAINCAILLKKGRYAVQQRNGTSYAAPLVAGVAALWLSHRREEIDSKYADDPAKIPLAFAKLLNEQCTPWDEDNCGPGIVNADKLLKADLPNPNDPELLVPRVIQYDENLALDQGGVVTFKHLFEATLSHPDVIRQISSRKLSDQQFLKEVGALSIMEWVLGKLVGRSGHSLTSFLSLFGRELTFHFGTNFKLYNLFVDALHTENIEESLPTVRQILCEVTSKDLQEELLKSSQKS
jgi:serine protease